MKRALLAGGIAVSFGGGVVACGLLVDLQPPPDAVESDGSARDGSAHDGAAHDGSLQDSATNDAGTQDSAPDASDAADSAGLACVPAVDAAGLVGLQQTVTAAAAQTIAAGVANQANTLLLQRGDGPCGADLSLLIADEPDPSTGYTVQPVTSPAGMDTSSEANVTISVDGTALIGLNAAHTGFLIATRPKLAFPVVPSADFGGPNHSADTGPFEYIHPPPGTTLWAPVMSSDELEFIYTVVKDDADGGSNAIYYSVRQTNSEFPSGSPLPVAIQDPVLYVSGITSDRQTLFVEVNTPWENEIFTWDAEAGDGGEFVNPNAPAKAPVGVRRARPYGTCNQIVATCPNLTCSDVPHGNTEEDICITP